MKNSKSKDLTLLSLNENPDGTKTPLTMPNHPKIKVSTLRTICTQAGISRDEFLNAYNKT
jgi:hypothetical protein